MTIGDVLAAIAALGLIAASWVALLVLAAYLFDAKVRAASARIESEPIRCGGRGLAVAAGAALLFAATTHLFVGPLRIVPWLLVGAAIALAVVGAAGIARTIAQRSATGIVAFGHVLRAAALLTLAGLFPIAGWLIAAPLALFVSLGAALPPLTLRRRKAPRADFLPATEGI